MFNIDDPSPVHAGRLRAALERRYRFNGVVKSSVILSKNWSRYDP